MRLTPLDVQQMQFPVRVRGFGRREVERFLDDVAQTLEGLTRDNQALRDKLAATEEQLASLRKSESSLTQALVSAQAAAEDVKQTAQRDAELIVKEAELKASELLREARQDLTSLQREVADMRKQRLLAIERLRATLQTFERMLALELTDEEHVHQGERGLLG